MIHPDKYLDEIGNIQVISISGELILYYKKYPDKLAEKLEDEKHHNVWINASLANKNITCATACIFDKSTERYSDTSIYKDNKGYYFKKGGKRYRIDDIANRYIKTYMYAKDKYINPVIPQIKEAGLSYPIIGKE